ncbi:MAG TPA: arginine deiminase family protein [Chryseolinea sp.]|nr:arginine deiminase family protein [Chryseolinea sp.]
MKVTCHSEYGKIRTLFIKSVEAAFVDESTLAGEWKGLNFLSKPDLNKSRNEYLGFESLLRRNNPDISFFPHDRSVSIDSIYCRDAALATDAGVIICNMGKPGRVNEPEAEKRAFERSGVRILGSIKSPGTFEGGDAAWIDDKTLAVGYTYRTNEAGIRQLVALLEPQGVEVITVPLPHYKGPSDVFHLMSIISPVDRDLAVVYSPLMPIQFRNDLIKRGFSFVEVPDEEFESMGCNVLAVAPRECVMVSGNPKTKSLLEKAGCKVFEYDGNEISVKGGGGPTCLTRPLLREI